MRNIVLALFLCLALSVGACSPVLTVNAVSHKEYSELTYNKSDLQLESEAILDNTQYSSLTTVETNSVIMNVSEKSFNYHLGKNLFESRYHICIR